MSYRLHGLASMLLFTIAVLTAMVVIARTSWPAVAGYAALNILSTFGIAWWYCAKCACRAHGCSHFLVGKVAEWLPKRRQGVYTPGDYADMLVSAGIVFVYPLPWLLRDIPLLIAFGALFALAALEIMLAVCPHCGNTRCPAAKWRERKTSQKS